MNQGEEAKNKRGALGHPGRQGSSLWEGSICAETSRRRSRGGILQIDRTKDLRQEQVSSQFPWINGSCFPATLLLEEETNHKLLFSEVPPHSWELCVTWYHRAHTPDLERPIRVEKNLSTIGIGEQWLFASKMHPSSTFQGLLGSHLFPAGSRESYSFAPMALTFRIITLS